MRSWLVCLLLLGICVSLTFLVVDTETRADRWNERITSLAHIEKLNQDLMLAQRFSVGYVEATRRLASENGLLCERDAKMVRLVAKFEEENRALKNSLAESVEHLENQITQINKLMEENSNLNWRIKTLEKMIDNVKENTFMDIFSQAFATFVPLMF